MRSHLFRWPGLARPAEDHPEPPPPRPSVFCLPLPPPGPPDRGVQHGIHDFRFDPCGAPPLDAEGAARRRGQQDG